MSEQLPDSALTHYSSLVLHKYKEHWGSLLNFLDVEDSDFLNNHIMSMKSTHPQRNPLQSQKQNLNGRSLTRPPMPSLSSEQRCAKNFLQPSVRKYLEEGEDMTNYVFKSPRRRIIMVSNRSLKPATESETAELLSQHSYDCLPTEATTKGLATINSDPSVEGLLQQMASNPGYQQLMFKKNKEELRDLVRSVEPRTASFRKSPSNAQRSSVPKKPQDPDEKEAGVSPLKAISPI